ncbi:hypothetical protein MICAF_2650021 [Microcystis aeruginosa PCC 9807]|uniref:Uncharacterized protein n=1 Tax=Microcystis aeruginosa PCC 9807 TaxID=1160283 RepID=I4H5J9_MICAE|nr:hypothetical protein MICAF_2650021 [Microcystis aeruginosa PCC 9807]
MLIVYRWWGKNVISYQLSVISYQLSVISYQLSVISLLTTEINSAYFLGLIFWGFI